jgi:hypothetical protein
VSDYKPSHKNKKYSEYTLVEKLLPPFLNYLIRKVLLSVLVVVLTVCRFTGDRFRFDISARVSDREEWIWLDDKELPVVKLDSKKVNTKKN